MSKPILKWAGGKAKLVPAILAAAPATFAAYHEPFFGGGAVFFALSHERRFQRAYLNDLNTDLIATYTAIRDQTSAVIDALQRLEVRYLTAPRDRRAEIYYEVRSNKPLGSADLAAWLLFLNKTCYNGLFRVNRRGGFNVPHGNYANPRILDAATLTAASHSLETAELSNTDFECAMRRARRGDFVYLDPPYQPLNATSSFTSYTSAEFGQAEQVRLRDAFDELTARGVAAVLSNSSHRFVRDLYEGREYTIDEVWMARAINSVGTGRSRIPELLVSNFSRPDVARACEASCVSV